jgi:hypothetical protein
MIQIRETYKVYAPPSWVRPTVERMLVCFSTEHVHGLAAVWLTDSASIDQGKTHRVRGRKYQNRKCLGFYHSRSPGSDAWIELVVDNILARRLPRPLDRFRIARDMALARTLFHEVGHHLHATGRSAGRTGEAGAEAWRRRLSRIYFRKNYRIRVAILATIRRSALGILRLITRLPRQE